MSDLVPRPGGAPVPAGGDNRYKAIQANLAKMAKTMEDVALELEALHHDMKANATHTTTVAQDVENADLDRMFVVLTNEVAVALGGAGLAVKDLGVLSHSVATQAYQAKRTHTKLYRALDDIRSNRRVKTPKPGFFTR